MAEFLFPDTTVLCNFAVIDRLDLLETHLTGRGRVVEAVEREIRNSMAMVPNLSKLEIEKWFGNPIRLDKQGQPEAIDVTRRAVFGGVPTKPTQHLGESQTLYAISNLADYSGSIWITDDRAAYNLGRKRNIVTRNTVDVFRFLIAAGEVTSQNAFEMCVGIQASRNLLFAPISAKDLES